jgi:stress-induced morphogen
MISKEYFLEKIEAALTEHLNNVSIFYDRDDYPDAATLIIVSDSFERMHAVNRANFILFLMKKTLGEELYNGLYSFVGMTSNEYNVRSK